MFKYIFIQKFFTPLKNIFNLQTHIQKGLDPISSYFSKGMVLHIFSWFVESILQQQFDSIA